MQYIAVLDYMQYIACIVYILISTLLGTKTGPELSMVHVAHIKSHGKPSRSGTPSGGKKHRG